MLYADGGASASGREYAVCCLFVYEYGVCNLPFRVKKGVLEFALSCVSCISWFNPQLFNPPSCLPSYAELWTMLWTSYEQVHAALPFHAQFYQQFNNNYEQHSAQVAILRITIWKIPRASKHTLLRRLQNLSRRNCFLRQNFHDLQDFMMLVFCGFKIMSILLILSKSGFASTCYIIFITRFVYSVCSVVILPFQPRNSELTTHNSKLATHNSKLSVLCG